MRRREFISLLGGAAIAWPLAAGAQQPQRMRRIAVLTGSGVGEGDADMQERFAAFQQALQEFGWTQGRNVQIDYRFASDNIRRHAAELIALAPDVFLASGAATMPSVLQATRSVPIVFTSVVDPVGAGFVESMARPGGNATGFVMLEYSMSSKHLELLKEIAPWVTRVAVLRDGAISSGTGQFGAIQAAAPSLRMEVTPVNVRDAGDRTLPNILCASPQWRIDCDGERVDRRSSRVDHPISCAAQTASRFPSAAVCLLWRPDVVWT